MLPAASTQSQTQTPPHTHTPKEDELLIGCELTQPVEEVGHIGGGAGHKGNNIAVALPLSLHISPTSILLSFSSATHPLHHLIRTL